MTPTLTKEVSLCFQPAPRFVSAFCPDRPISPGQSAQLRSRAAQRGSGVVNEVKYNGVYLVCAHLSLIDSNLYSAHLRSQEQRSANKSRSWPWLPGITVGLCSPWGPRGQTLLHTALSYFQSLFMLRSPQPHWGSIRFLRWALKTTSFMHIQAQACPWGTHAKPSSLWTKQTTQSGGCRAIHLAYWLVARLNPKGTAGSWDEW